MKVEYVLEIYVSFLFANSVELLVATQKNESHIFYVVLL